jgi:hypothetical protein
VVVAAGKTAAAAGVVEVETVVASVRVVAVVVVVGLLYWERFASAGLVPRRVVCTAAAEVVEVVA